MQRYRIVILIVLFGVLPVVAAFFVALSFLKEEADDKEVAGAAAPVVEVEAPPPPPETRRVLAAARALPVGTLIGEEDLTERAIEDAAIRKGQHFLVEDRKTRPLRGEDRKAHPLRGHAVREALAAGEAITRSSVVGPGQQGFLATVLGPGTRAVTIRVGPATSHAGLVDPGDRVDVILSAELQATERERSVLTRTIIEDARVVAVDRRLENSVGPSGDNADSSADDGRVQRTEMITATLEVSPSQGERLVLGDREGRLSLAVRSLTAAAPRSWRSAVQLQDLLPSPQAVGPEDPVPFRTVRVFRGSEPAEEVLFVQEQ